MKIKRGSIIILIFSKIDTKLQINSWFYYLNATLWHTDKLGLKTWMELAVCFQYMDKNYHPFFIRHFLTAYG